MDTVRKGANYLNGRLAHDKDADIIKWWGGIPPQRGTRELKAAVRFYLSKEHSDTPATRAELIEAHDSLITRVDELQTEISKLTRVVATLMQQISSGGAVVIAAPKQSADRLSDEQLATRSANMNSKKW